MRAGPRDSYGWARVRLLLLAVACSARAAAAAFQCCTACIGPSPPVCCAGLFGGVANDAAQCAALAALYGAAGGSSWHLRADWAAAKQAGYGGANAPRARIDVRNPHISEALKPFVANTPPNGIWSATSKSGVVASLPGHGYDYYDAWKYEYDALDSSYVYTDGGGGATEATWPNGAQLANSFPGHVGAVTGGWAAAAAGTPTDYCTFYGVFCDDAGDVLILCAPAGRGARFSKRPRVHAGARLADARAVARPDAASCRATTLWAVRRRRWPA